MKILVTGGAGFVGRHLANSFLDGNHAVTIFDNLSNSKVSKVSNILNDGALLVKGDVTDYKSILKHTRGIDLVVHLAAKINVAESVASPELTHAVNVTGTLNLMRACVANGVPSVIAASSAAVYGDSGKLPLSEFPATVPISPYGASKLAIEHYLQAFSHSYSINTVSLRFFNIYGAGQSAAYAGVIEKFMERINQNKSLVIYGNGKNTRDFVSISDVSRAVTLAMKKISGKKGNVYNIATGRSVSINDLARMMISISGRRLGIVHKSPQKGDIRHSRASIDLARRELGYVPRTSLREGLGNLMNEAGPV